MVNSVTFDLSGSSESPAQRAGHSAPVLAVMAAPFQRPVGRAHRCSKVAGATSRQWRGRRAVAARLLTPWWPDRTGSVGSDFLSRGRGRDRDGG
jgi:hypothetical protein